MANNIQNRSWKIRLDEMEEPGLDPSRKNILWARLDQRLQEQPKRRSAVPMLVAASIMAVLITAWVLRAYFQAGIVKQQVIESTVVKNALPPPVISNKDQGRTMVNNKKIIHAEKTMPHKGIRNKPELMIVHEKIIPQVNAVDNASIVIKKELPDSLFKVKEFLAGERKKLNVVHVNELPEHGPVILEIIPYNKYLRSPASSIGIKNKKDPHNRDHILVNF